MTARRTIKKEVAAEGIALHSGMQVRMLLAPAAPGVGVIFRRSDLDGAEIRARYDFVGETDFNTVLESGRAKVGVVEHLMAAVAGAGIDDLVVILDGPEPPILDGDALCFLELLDLAGVKDQPVERQAIKVLRRVELAHANGSRVALVPAAALAFRFEIDFPCAAIGHQTMTFDFTLEGFRREIAPSRTFGDVSQVDWMKARNRGYGASLDNTLAYSGDRWLNPERMRFQDEPVRHKILDAVGDMALAGAPLIARFEGVKSGHALNNAVLRTLFADPGNYRLVTPS